MIKYLPKRIEKLHFSFYFCYFLILKLHSELFQQGYTSPSSSFPDLIFIFLFMERSKLLLYSNSIFFCWGIGNWIFSSSPKREELSFSTLDFFFSGFSSASKFRVSINEKLAPFLKQEIVIAWWCHFLIKKWNWFSHDMETLFCSGS